MKVVSFWSPQPGHGSVTSNVITSTAILGVEHQQKTLLIHTGYAGTNLDAYLINKEKHHFVPSLNDDGIDGLKRLAKSNRLSAQALNDYTTTLIPGRMDVLKGKNRIQQDDDAGKALFTQIIQHSSTIYNLAFIDTHASSSADYLLELSDLVVVCLNQNQYHLDRFFGKEDWPAALDKKPYIVVLGQYDPYSKLSHKNIQRRYNLKVPLYPIPYCSDFRNACNDREPLSFFIRAKKFKKSHASYPFIQEARKLAKGILSHTGLNTEQNGQEKGAS